MKINVGCGSRVKDGWVNCDLAHNPDAPREPDILCDARHIPLDDGVADEVMAIHLLEHFYVWEAYDALREWWRLLRPGGRLVLELPDLEKCCRNILNGVREKAPGQLGMWGLYGDPRLENPLMCHRWAWTPKSLKSALGEVGFVSVATERPQFHPAGKVLRDMRLVAVK